MAITSEIIGKLGGAGLEVIPVEGVASGPPSSSTVLAAIDVPAGETWLVAVIGETFGATSSNSSQPRLHLGDEFSIQPPAGAHSFATTVSETVSFTMERRYGLGTDSYTGHVYAVKL